MEALQVLLDSYVSLGELTPLFELAAGVGLGLSIFVEPYTSGRARINEQLKTVEGFYDGLSQESPKWTALNEAADRLEDAESAMKCIIRGAITLSLVTAAVAFTSLIVAISASGALVSIALVVLLGMFFLTIYGGVAIGVAIASRHHFGEVESLIRLALKAPAAPKS